MAGETAFHKICKQGSIHYSSVHRNFSITGLGGWLGRSKSNAESEKDGGSDKGISPGQPCTLAASFSDDPRVIHSMQVAPRCARSGQISKIWIFSTVRPQVSALFLIKVKEDALVMNRLSAIPHRESKKSHITGCGY